MYSTGLMKIGPLWFFEGSCTWGQYGCLPKVQEGGAGEAVSPVPSSEGPRVFSSEVGNMSPSPPQDGGLMPWLWFFEGKLPQGPMQQPPPGLWEWWIEWGTWATGGSQFFFSGKVETRGKAAKLPHIHEGGALRVAPGGSMTWFGTFTQGSAASRGLEV